MANEKSTVKPALGLVQWGVIVLTLATAVIHLYLNVIMGKIDLLFTLNGIGYLVLLAALFLPHPMLIRYRTLIRSALMLFILVTILAWVFLGDRGPLGYIDKAIEIALLVLLWLDRDR